MPGNARHFLFYQHLFKSNRINIFELQKALLKIHNFSYMARILVLLVLIISSCTIQKRHFTKGYAVEWKKDYASANDDAINLNNEPIEPCDTIHKKDDSIVLAAVQRIDSKKIYVVPCEGSSYTSDNLNRSEVKTINYANGAIFENKTPEELQKEREENLEKYRTGKEAYEKELVMKEQQRLEAENEALKAKNNELENENKQLKNDVSINQDYEENVSNEVVVEPLMRGFFITGFAIAGLTLLLTLIDPSGAVSSIGLAVLFVTDVVSPFIVLASLIKKHRDKGKYKGRPILLELLFALVSFGALLIWISIHL